MKILLLGVASVVLYHLIPSDLPTLKFAIVVTCAGLAFSLLEMERWQPLCLLLSVGLLLATDVRIGLMSLPFLLFIAPFSKRHEQMPASSPFPTSLESPLCGSDGLPFLLVGQSAHARISGPLASVTVRQTFSNSRDVPIGAMYAFPLPCGSAVFDFRMTVGTRVFQGKVVERSQARAIYQQAVARGRSAALMDQQKDNLFTVTVGQVPPGLDLQIELRYCERLDSSGGEHEFRWPGRRATQLRVELELAGQVLQCLSCGQQELVQTNTPTGLQLEMTVSARDFVMRFAVGEGNVPATLLHYGEHYLLTLHPPRRPPQTVARDVVLLVDRSGSMTGANMGMARRCVELLLGQLRDEDRFALWAFDDRVETFREGKLVGSLEAADAMTWLEKVSARGGTDIDTPLQNALKMAKSGSIVLITDGQVNNEEDLFRNVQSLLEGWRVFTIGIDDHVNDGCLRRLAALGGGTCELLMPLDALEAPLLRIAAEMGNAVVTQLRVDGVALPDLYAGRPLVHSGRFRKPGPIDVVGRDFHLRVSPQVSSNPALAKVWARDRIREAEDRLRISSPLLRGRRRRQLLQLSLEANLVSKVTSFVVVDEATGTRGPATEWTESASTPSTGKKPESVVQLMQVDALTVEVARDLLLLLEGPLPAKGTQVREQLSRELGFPVPGVRFRDNLQLRPGEFVIRVKEIEVARAEVRPDRYLAIGPESALANLEGEETREPTYGLAAKWVEKAHVNVLCFDSVAVIATRLAEVIRSHAADLLGRQEVQTIYDRVKKVLPTSIVPQLLSLGEVQLVLQNLLREGVSIRKLQTILNSIAFPGLDEVRTERARTALAAEICAQYTDEGGMMDVLRVHPELIDPEEIIVLLAEPVRQLQEQGIQPIVVTSPAVRPKLRRLCDPSIVLLSSNEIAPGVRIHCIATLGHELALC